nr:YbjN domain-containing protein [Kibdelosporangium phytohabitans]
MEYVFDEESDRTQVMIVVREELDRKYEWVQIATPLGLAKDCDLHRLLETIGQTTVSGGAAIMGEHIVIRHSLPLENLDINEFTDPLALIAGAADNLESEFFGGDNY